MIGCSLRGIMAAGFVQTGWDISNASLNAIRSTAPTINTTTPRDIVFSADGTKIYILGENELTIYQYALSTAWDLTTVSNDFKSFEPQQGDNANLNSIFFKPDGTKLYVLNAYYDENIHQFSLSTAWDISTASYDSKLYSVRSQDQASSALFLKPDGTKAYVLGNFGNSVYQYSLSTAWDISTASYDSKSFSVGTQDTTPQSLFFEDDGSQMYVLGDSNKTIYQYSLSTVWDVSTASYDSESFLFTTQDATPEAIYFRPTGLELYMVGSGSLRIYKYTFGTAWDLSTISYNVTTTVSTQINNFTSEPSDIFFKTDGLTIYVLDTLGDSVFQYSLSTAWDASTININAGEFKSYSFKSQAASGSTLLFKSDGTKLYILGDNENLYQYSLSTAWDITTASYDSVFVDLTTQDATPVTALFSPDGTKLHVVGNSTQTLYQYLLSTAWDLSTVTYTTNKSFSVYTQADDSNGICFRPDGTKFYITDDDDNRIYQYDLSTAWDVSTASYPSKSYLVSSQDTHPTGVAFKTDGTKMYVVGYTNEAVFQYSLSTAWDVSTASYDSDSLDYGTQDGVGTGVVFKTDGTKMYVLGDVNDTVFQYGLSTAWDVSSASYDSKSFDVSSETFGPQGLFLKTDGLKLYIIGSDEVFQYTLSTAWDISTASYDSVSYDIENDDTNAEGLAFKSDGTEFYIVGYENNTVYQYTLGTAWTVNSVLKYFISLSPYATKIAFNSAGTKMFSVVADTTDTVYQYSLDAWSISTLSYDDISKKIIQQDTDMQGIALSSDENKLYLLGQYSDIFYQYALGATNDISQLYYGAGYFAITEFVDDNRAVFLNPDGTKAYFLTIDTIYQYSFGTAWDVTTLSYDSKSYDFSSRNKDPSNLAFKPDGTEVYVIGVYNVPFGQSGTPIHQFNLSTAWDISTATYDSVFDIYPTADDLEPQSLIFNSDGTKFIVGGQDVNTMIYQYTLSTAWDISSASHDDNDVTITTSTAILRYISPTGHKIYLLGNEVEQFGLSTTWDVTTHSTNSQAEIVYIDGEYLYSLSATDISFNNEGTKIYILMDGNNALYQLDL